MRELLFSVTASDCRFDYFRGSGAGGQKRNKTASKVRCTHIPSGAVATSDDTRSQHRNKRTAFRRMAESPRFAAWHKRKTAEMLGSAAAIEDAVDRQMQPEKIRVETRAAGRWAE